MVDPQNLDNVPSRRSSESGRGSTQNPIPLPPLASQASQTYTPTPPPASLDPNMATFMTSTVDTMNKMGTMLSMMMANFSVMATAPPTSTTPSPLEPERKLPPGVKPPTPNRFDGSDRRKTPAWLEQTKQTLQLAGWSLTDPTAIAYTASFLTGKAHQWWETEMRTCPPDHEHIASAGFSTWTEFAEAALDALGEDRRQDRARERLIKLSQTSSVLTYGERFTSIMQLLPDMHWSDARFFYLRGLKPAILSIITGKFLPTDTWQIIHALAMSADSIRLPITSTNRFQSLSRENHDPMDIGTLNTSRPPSSAKSRTSSPSPRRNRPPTPHRPRLSKLTDAEREQLRSIGACFRCRKVGHKIGDPECPLASSFPPKTRHPSAGRSPARSASPVPKN